MTSIKELQVGVQLPKLNIKTLLRQKPPHGGGALLGRVTMTTTFALLTRRGARTGGTLILAMGLRRACVYDL